MKPPFNFIRQKINNLFFAKKTPPIMNEQLQTKEPSHFNIVLGFLRQSHFCQNRKFSSSHLYSKMTKAGVKLTKQQFHKVMWRFRHRKVLIVCGSVSEHSSYLNLSHKYKVGEPLYKMNEKWKQ